jgi:exodeoxyribonuclease VII small subunit
MAQRPRKSDASADAAGGSGFEQRLEALEAIVRELEGEGLTLEASLARYQQGVEHLKACRALLDGAEKRLLELIEQPDGAAAERALRVTEQGLAPAGPGADDEGDDEPV